ncbi:hypothetical protein [Crateriforma conspicua]|uniref:hypothetical protein n=1 Tax=Crateriforma conspicua TaxID=2527996 RepID=UPI00118BFD73|nr:hypothetical protein [Crateriforma conspicua]QDV61979.1 hypothetical protein Mal65_11070 [Crateriforma conspicua]
MYDKHIDSFDSELLIRISEAYEGPFVYERGVDGTDKTFDVYCQTSDTHLLSVPFWEAKDWAEKLTATVVRFMNAQQRRDES